MDDSKDAKKFAARAGSKVDENRWRGGLEPTMLGVGVFGGSGYSGEAERQRKKLNKVKRVVDHWVEKQFEKRVEESRLVMKIKEKKERTRQENMRMGIKVEDVDTDGHGQDYTEYGTNEHEMLAKARDEESMEIAASNHTMMVSEKWSLDRALLLHGSSNEIPAIYTEYNPLTGQAPRDIDEERQVLLKRIDASQRKASIELYRAYCLIHGSLNRLSLGTGGEVLAEIMELVCRYVNAKGSFSVKGVSSRIDKKSTVSGSGGSGSIEEQRNYNKARQMSALGTAFIYLMCKKNGLGRTLVEICASFQFDDFARIQKHGGIDVKSNANGNSNGNGVNNSEEPFIKAKHCSKAMAEIRTLLPDYIQSVAQASGDRIANEKKNANSTSSATIITASSTSSSSVSASVTVSTLPDITNLLQHSISKLNLSAAANLAIHSLVLYVQKTEIDNTNFNSNSAPTRPAVLIAAVAYLVCDAGTTMQRLASQAIKNSKVSKQDKLLKREKEKVKDRKIKNEHVKEEPDSIGSNNNNNNMSSADKRKHIHIRPGGSRKRRRVTSANILSSSSTMNNDNSSVTSSASSSSTASSMLIPPSVPSSAVAVAQSVAAIKVEEIASASHIGSSAGEAGESEGGTSRITPESVPSASFDVLSHAPIDNTSSRSILSWEEWSREKPWSKTVQDIADSCFVGLTAVRECYRKKVYPRRKEFLKILSSASNRIDDCGDSRITTNSTTTTSMDVLMKNFAAAAPLLNST
eukprot:CAMPEP_0194106834 /NCGR_PEP_ID=MMETSP0150-20130528/6806_1 /TAXON_ID=122233 /ORGANISM="Chaetoceros debilis, Strain MM31A-1" /LENGTH=748 /DNA_ID=CAMNT_0038795087 /DNA_START=391 /DNA_END=2633 /DNA_ORIENTATION=+